MTPTPPTDRDRELAREAVAALNAVGGPVRTSTDIYLAGLAAGRVESMEKVERILIEHLGDLELDMVLTAIRKQES